MFDCTVSVQADADKITPTSKCFDIDIRGASGTLNFTDLQTALSVTVQDSPELALLSFPQLQNLVQMDIVNATALTNISLPKLISSNSSKSLSRSPLSLNITTAPSLANIQMGGSEFLFTLVLIDTPVLGFDEVTDQVTWVSSIQVDSRKRFNRLRDVERLAIFARPNWSYSLDSLKSVGNFTLSNANNFFPTNLHTDEGSPAIQVNDTLTISSGVPSQNLKGTNIEFSRITSVGQNMKVSSMSDVGIRFDGLTDVGASLELSGNTNCFFTFEKLSSVTNLVALDNTNTTLPLFLQLRSAENIHLRGIIDT